MDDDSEDDETKDEVRSLNILEISNLAIIADLAAKMVVKNDCRGNSAQSLSIETQISRLSYHHPNTR